MARLLAVLLLLIAAPAAAQGSGAPGWLLGSWRGAGTMFGAPSEATLTIEPTLEGFALDYRAGAFAGQAAYRALGGGRWQADWTDNRGTSLSIEAVEEEQMLTAEWSGAERGRTVYRLAEDGRLHLTDSVAGPDGSFRDFANHVLTRAD